MLNIGLFLGSFNPIHTGHMIIANVMAWHTDLDEVWIVVSPHNPFKEKIGLAPEKRRLQMAKIAVRSNERLKVSDIEFSLPRPSYTIDTVTKLQSRYPEDNFSLVMGSDNLKSFHRWKDSEKLLEKTGIYVYRRTSRVSSELLQRKNVRIIDAPLLKISATQIRRFIKEDKSIRYMVPDTVLRYILRHGLYKD